MKSAELAACIALSAIVFSFSSISPCVRAENPSKFTTGVLGIKGLVVPFYQYSQGRATPTAVLRIDRFAIDFQRKGFFRIGVLPMLVADGVTLQFLEPSSVGVALERTRSQIQRACGVGVLELRRVTFTFPDQFDLQLKAKRVQFGENGQWELLDGVSCRAATNRWQARSAVLQATGKGAGQITFPSAPPLSFNLFCPKSETNSVAKQPED